MTGRSERIGDFWSPHLGGDETPSAGRIGSWDRFRRRKDADGYPAGSNPAGDPGDETPLVGAGSKRGSPVTHGRMDRMGMHRMPEVRPSPVFHFAGGSVFRVIGELVVLVVVVAGWTLILAHWRKKPKNRDDDWPWWG